MGDVQRLADTPEGDVRGQRGGVAEAAQRRSRDQAGLDAVDGDAVAGQPSAAARMKPLTPALLAA